MIAANKTVIKNTIEITCPQSKDLKIVGIVINISGGPDCSLFSRPKEKAARIITNAAKIGKIKLNTVTLPAHEITYSFSLK